MLMLLVREPHFEKDCLLYANDTWHYLHIIAWLLTTEKDQSLKLDNIGLPFSQIFQETEL